MSPRCVGIEHNRNIIWQQYTSSEQSNYGTSWLKTAAVLQQQYNSSRLVKSSIGHASRNVTNVTGNCNSLKVDVTQLQQQ